MQVGGRRVRTMSASRGSGGTVYATASKAVELTLLWVRIPPSLLSGLPVMQCHGFTVEYRMNRPLLMCCLLALAPNVTWAQDAIVPHATLDFGVNGHPLNAASYDGPLEQQISVLKTLGLRAYRVNVNPAYPDRFGRLSQLITIARQQDIVILPVVVMNAQKYSSENTAYEDSRMMVYDLARAFDTRIAVWELGSCPREWCTST